MPYAFFYMECLGNDNEIHIITWNRDGEEDIKPHVGTHVHEFLCKQQNQVEKKSKISNFVRYRKYALSIIKEIKPDRVISLHTLPGILLFDILTGKYKRRYIYDYRDFTYENIPAFRYMVSQLVKKSSATFVSSDGFRKYLPKKCDNKIFTSHNITNDLIERNMLFHKRNSQEVLRVGFWGIVRNEKFNKQIIFRLANDKRFELHFFGKEEKVVENLKKYCVEEIASNNVFFHGAYQPDDRYTFCNYIDIIHNMYSDNNMMIAISNKMYDGIFLCIPQICFVGSYMGQIVEKRHVGLALNPFDNDFNDMLYDYYNSLSGESFMNACNMAQKEIASQYKEAGLIVQQFAMNG